MFNFTYSVGLLGFGLFGLFLPRLLVLGWFLLVFAVWLGGCVFCGFVGVGFCCVFLVCSRVFSFVFVVCFKFYLVVDTLGGLVVFFSVWYCLFYLFLLLCVVFFFFWLF